MKSIPHPPTWYSASQAMICLLGALLLLTLWQRSASSTRKPRDLGSFYLSMAILVWGLIGIGLVLRVCPPDWSLKRCLPAVMASTLSNSFLLLAMAYFEYGPIEFKIAQDDWKWHFAVLSASIFIALLVFLAQSAWPDFMLSVATLSILGLSAYLTFKSHGYIWTSKFSILVILLTLVTRYWESIDVSDLLFELREEWLWILLLTAKTSIITLFLALGFDGLSSKDKPVSKDDLRIEFAGKENANYTWIVILSVPGMFERKKIEMPPVLHQILLSFAAERRHQGPHNGWIKIKRKYYPSDLSRISRKLGVAAPRIFENDLNGGYRLRVLPENIIIQEKNFKIYPELMKMIVNSNKS
jgi:hypothetical protein